MGVREFGSIRSRQEWCPTETKVGTQIIGKFRCRGRDEADFLLPSTSAFGRGCVKTRAPGSALEKSSTHLLVAALQCPHEPPRKRFSSLQEG